MKDLIVNKLRETSGNLLSNTLYNDMAEAVLSINETDLGENPFDSMPFDTKIYNSELQESFKNYFNRSETPKWIKLQLKKWAFIRGFRLKMSQDAKGRYTIIHEK